MDIFDRLKAEAAADWSSYVDHSFVRQLGEGTLPQAAFRTYLVQDYLFLIQPGVLRSSTWRRTCMSGAAAAGV